MISFNVRRRCFATDCGESVNQAGTSRSETHGFSVGFVSSYRTAHLIPLGTLKRELQPAGRVIPVGVQPSGCPSIPGRMFLYTEAARSCDLALLWPLNAARTGPPRGHRLHSGDSTDSASGFHTLR